MRKPRILWNLFHPKLSASRGNKRILDAVKGLPMTLVDHYAQTPGFKIDVKREQKRLLEHDLIVFQHPFYWYSTPALMKEWQDQVLEYGFAYPPKEGRALHGKCWLSVITTGGPDWAYRSGGYNNFSMSELLKPLQQTAYLCGMKWLAPFVAHGVLPGDHEGLVAIKDQELDSVGKRLRDFLAGYDLDARHSWEPVIAPHSIPL